MKEIESIFMAIGIVTSVLIVGGAVFYVFWFHKEIWPDFERDFKDLRTNMYEHKSQI